MLLYLCISLLFLLIFGYIGASNKVVFFANGQAKIYDWKYVSYQNNLKMKYKYSGSINIIEKYITFLIMLYILNFYIKKDCIEKYGYK